MKPINFFYRIFQKVLYLSMFFLPFREPKVFDSLDNVVSILKSKQKDKVFIITDQNIVKQSFFEIIKDALRQNDIDYFIFHDTLPNPSISQIEEIFQLYLSENATAMIAVGGGSVIDAAKGVGIKITHPKKPLQKMKGILKVLKRQPLLIAIPTTAGTGSEATVACVVTDTKTHEKYAINDPIIIPKYAILDPRSTLGLPPHITASTGMDALTHAIEAYIGYANTKKTRRMALSAIKLIENNLYLSYQDGSNIDARKNMLKASYQAGVAFTRAYVGNVHALAHQLGGMYHVPHGLANAILLPRVLHYYGDSITKRLAKISDVLMLNNSSDSIRGKALSVISWIENLNNKMNIPTTLDFKLNDEDIAVMSKRAYKEANPLYPVPKIFEVEDFTTLYHQISS